MEEKTQTPHAVLEVMGSFERISEAANTLSWEAMTQAQAAKSLGVSRTTISSWITRGQVQAAHAGGYPFIPIKEIARLEKVVAGEAKHIKATK